MNGWSLPESAVIGGTVYQINADYRDILDIISRLNDPEEAVQVRVYVALALFYDSFDTMPGSDYGDAIRWMFDFISCGEAPGTHPRAKTIDWDQDRAMIVADINKVAGCEVRALPFCHWWTFVAWFNSIGEGQLATVVSIREKLRKGKKLSDWERDFYRDNREKVDFKTKITAEEEEILSRWIRKAR